MKTSVEINVDASKGVNRLIKGLDFATQKDAVALLSDIFINEVNKYVPEDTGKLKQKGYKLAIHTPKNKTAWFKVTYANTEDLPYVIYQYNGVVYGPNRALFAQGPSRTGATGVHIGWYSPISPKRKTNRILGHPARTTITLRDGRIINIPGYTGNKQAHAKWLEYVRETSTIWYPLRRKMLDEIRGFIKQGMDNGR